MRLLRGEHVDSALQNKVSFVLWNVRCSAQLERGRFIQKSREERAKSQRGRRTGVRCALLSR